MLINSSNIPSEFQRLHLWFPAQINEGAAAVGQVQGGGPREAERETGAGENQVSS